MTFKNNANPGKWRSGWPPFTHWWNMSPCQHTDIWRWVDVDRKFISFACSQEASKEDVLFLAKENSSCAIRDLRYTDYWPKNARVDRVAPKGK